MTTRNQHQGNEARPKEAGAPHVTPARKTFVEPTISSPIDVLEATTFFQAVESGATSRKKPD